MFSHYVQTFLPRLHAKQEMKKSSVADPETSMLAARAHTYQTGVHLSVHPPSALHLVVQRHADVLESVPLFAITVADHRHRDFVEYVRPGFTYSSQRRSKLLINP
jgi:hypothetical protein